MKKCLIVVDYQNDFVCGSLGNENAREIDERIAFKINQYHDNNDCVIFTFDTHGADYLSTREGRYLPVEHCIRGTEGHRLYGKTADCARDNDIRLYKGSFGSDELYEYIKANHFDSIELVGVVTDICVISNAVLAKTAAPETDVIVDASCVASNDNELNNAALKVMKSMQIDIINGKEEDKNE